MWQAVCGVVWAAAAAVGLATAPMPAEHVRKHVNSVINTLALDERATDDLRTDFMSPTSWLMYAALRDAPLAAHLSDRDARGRIWFFCEKCAELRAILLRGKDDVFVVARFDPTLPQRPANLIAELSEQKQALENLQRQPRYDSKVIAMQKTFLNIMRSSNRKVMQDTEKDNLTHAGTQ